jgi:hypothetical protein
MARSQGLKASGGQGALFEKTAPWTPAKTFDYFHVTPGKAIFNLS